VNAFALQHFGGADAFPGGSDLDQHMLVAHARFVVETDQLARLGQRGGGIERETRIDFGRDAPGNAF